MTALKVFGVGVITFLVTISVDLSMGNEEPGQLSVTSAVIAVCAYHYLFHRSQ